MQQKPTTNQQNGYNQQSGYNQQNGYNQQYLNQYNHHSNQYQNQYHNQHQNQQQNTNQHYMYQQQNVPYQTHHSYQQQYHHQTYNNTPMQQQTNQYKYDNKYNNNSNNNYSYYNNNNINSNNNDSHIQMINQLKDENNIIRDKYDKLKEDYNIKLELNKALKDTLESIQIKYDKRINDLLSQNNRLRNELSVYRNNGENIQNNNDSNMDDIIQERPTKKQKLNDGSSNDTTNDDMSPYRIFVRGLKGHIYWNDWKKFWEKYGDVVYANVVSGQGYGFVTFKHPTDASNVVRISKSQSIYFNGSKLVITFSKKNKIDREREFKIDREKEYNTNHNNYNTNDVSIKMEPTNVDTPSNSTSNEGITTETAKTEVIKIENINTDNDKDNNITQNKIKKEIKNLKKIIEKKDGLIKTLTNLIESKNKEIAKLKNEDKMRLFYTEKINKIHDLYKNGVMPMIKKVNIIARNDTESGIESQFRSDFIHEIYLHTRLNGGNGFDGYEVVLKDEFSKYSVSIKSYLNINDEYSVSPKVVIQGNMDNNDDNVDTDIDMEPKLQNLNDTIQVFHLNPNQQGIESLVDIKENTCIGQYFGSEYTVDEFNKIYECTNEEYMRKCYSFNVHISVTAEIIQNAQTNVNDKINKFEMKDNSDVNVEMMIDGYKNEYNIFTNLNDCRNDIHTNPTDDELKQCNIDFIECKGILSIRLYIYILII